MFRNVWRQQAMVPWKRRTHNSIARLAQRRAGLGGHRLADIAILPHTVSGGFRA